MKNKDAMVIKKALDNAVKYIGKDNLLSQELENPKEEKAQTRKSTPVFSGVLAYFPDALKEVARASLAGNKQHLDGKPLHWDRTKSMDQLDALTRHLIDHASGEIIDDDGVYHMAKVAWRALAQLQLMIEQK